MLTRIITSIYLYVNHHELFEAFVFILKCPRVICIYFKVSALVKCGRQKDLAFPRAWLIMGIFFHPKDQKETNGSP